MLSPKPGFSLNPEPWTFLTPSKSWTPQAMAVQTRRGRDFLRDAQQRHRSRALTSFMKYLACTRIFPFVICASIYNIYAAYTFFSIYIYTHRHDKCVYGCVMAQLSVCVYVWVYVSLHLSNASTICCHTMLYYDAMFYYVMLYMVLLCCVARLLRLLYRAALFYTMFSEQYNVIPDCVMSCSTAFCSVFFYHMLWYDIRNS